MNTILDNIQCVEGLCHHPEHKFNLLYWILGVAITFLIIKYSHYGIINRRNK